MGDEEQQPPSWMVLDNDSEEEDKTQVGEFLRIALGEPHFNAANRSLCEEKFSSEAIHTLGKNEMEMENDGVRRRQKSDRCDV